MHHISQKRKGKVGDMAFKLDMSKAYDRVEWACLENNMLQLGFHRKLVDTVLSCVSAVVYSVSINRQPQGRIIPSHGLRQGDPLSPYLFLLCVERLSALIWRASERSSLTGILVSRHAPRITHLFFVNDSLIFCKSTLEECLELEHIFNLYEANSGQQLNKNKTTLFFSKNTHQAIQEEIKSQFGA